MDPTKKISFGFSRLPKKPNVILNKVNEKKPENDKELIQCLEENSIKLINENDKQETPLVIPVQPSRTSAALASLKLRQAILSGNLEDEEKSTKTQSEDSNKANPTQTVEGDANESLEQKAARELLEEIQNKKNVETIDTEVAVPLKPDELPLDGAKESNIEDYEQIPISQFGLAMLRGMGWKDEEKKDDKFNSDQPTLRPKGMGLGADKVLRTKTLLVAPEKNEKLEIKKNAYIRILGGKHKDLYGQIEGLDDHAGRVIVKLALGGGRESLNEFLVQPISKGEYIKYGKVINSAKYEEYKKKQENEQKERIQVKREKIKKENETQIKVEIDDMKKEIKKEKFNKYYHESSNSSKNNETIETEGNKSRSHKNDRRELENKYRSRERERSSGRYDMRHNNSEESSVTSEDSSDYHHHHHRSKKKSSKSRKDKSKDRNRRYHSGSSEENDKRHKKKTKKSKKEKARSRSRGRR